MRCAQLIGVDSGMQIHLGDAGTEIEQRAFHVLAPTYSAVEDEMVREDHPFRFGEVAVREPHEPLTARAAHPQWKRELHRELEIHVEEVGAQLERAHMAVE